MLLLDRKVSAAIATLQSLDDAIAFRLGRLGQHCQDCAEDQKCTVHSYDEHLIERYHARYAAAFCDAITGMDPYEIDQLMRRGDGMPRTAALLSAVVLRRVLEIAADGPAVTGLDASPGTTVTRQGRGTFIAPSPGDTTIA